MPPTAQSPLVFQSAGKPIRLDAYLPDTPDAPVPTVIALHGAGGNVSGMDRYATVLADKGSQFTCCIILTAPALNLPTYSQ